MKQKIMILDLKDDENLILEYEKYHSKVWGEILSAIKSCGIENMRIYRYETRLVMLLDYEDEQSLIKLSQLSKTIPKVKQWEDLMDKFQARLKEDEKWLDTKEIFNLKEST